MCNAQIGKRTPLGFVGTLRYLKPVGHTTRAIASVYRIEVSDACMPAGWGERAEQNTFRTAQHAPCTNYTTRLGDVIRMTAFYVTTA